MRHSRHSVGEEEAGVMVEVEGVMVEVEVEGVMEEVTGEEAMGEGAMEEEADMGEGVDTEEVTDMGEATEEAIEAYTAAVGAGAPGFPHSTTSWK